MLLKTFIFVICGALSVRCQVTSSPGEPVTEAPPCSEGEFRCKNGACVDGLSRCNDTSECPDRSDETCKNERSLLPSCILPPLPEKGMYLVPGNTKWIPGDRLDEATLYFICKTPYQMVGKQLVQCYKGAWSGEFPTCKSSCRLFKHPSINYRCLLNGTHSLEGSRLCGDLEPIGTTVQPECQRPNYYYPGPIPFMHCGEKGWDVEVLCTPECGRMPPKGTQLIAGGRPAERDELPWHAGIYSKVTSPFTQICGGTVISRKVLISAAHCFWKDRHRLPPKNYAAAAGKLYREWNHPDDVGAQQRDVIDLKIPARYQGSSTSFQDDIALVVLKFGLIYTVHVRPVCIDFEYEFDALQLQPVNKGKVAGWGLTSELGEPSPILKVVDLPYVSIEDCIARTPPSYKEYITSDKICAGYDNGTAVCKGDSGGGLVFPEPERGVMRHYLRGIVSTAPGSDYRCNTFTVTSFTHLIAHLNFIKNHFQSFTESKFQYFNPDGRNS